MKRQIAPRQVAVGVALVGLGWLLNSASQPFQRNAQKSTCRSNLLQIGLATLQYARDYDEYFPLAPSWADSLSPYTLTTRNREAGFQQRFRCPTSGAYYAFNEFCADDYNNKFGNWQNPTAIPLAFDVSWGTRNFSDDGSLWPLQPVHRAGKYGGNNVVFADGHAKLMTEKPNFRALATPTPTPKPPSKTKPEVAR